LVLKKVTDNFLVPLHEIVPKERVQELLNELGQTIDSLPKLASDDPVVSEIKAERGDVIRIIRDSPTAKKTIYFRVVN
jgi:DNA-directed RNA polymerase subunit H